MKTLLNLIVLFSLFMSFGQEKMISKTRSVTTVGETAVTANNAYNLLTGERFNQKQLNELLRNNPNVYVEHEYDKYGKIVKFWFNPNKVMGRPTTIGRTATGEKFPEFAFTSIDGTTMDSVDLKGKWIIIRFEGHPENYMFKAHEIKELDEKISAFEKTGQQVAAFDVFGWDSHKAKELFVVEKSKFHLVPNGSNFHRKFKINRTPKTLVINPNGVLMGYHNYSEDIDLFALLEKQ